MRRSFISSRSSPLTGSNGGNGEGERYQLRDMMVGARLTTRADWESEAHGQRTYYVEGFGLIGEADLGRFIPNFSQFITMAGEEQWHDMQIGDTFEGTAFDKPVRLTRRS